MRSLLFNALFYANLIVHMVVALPAFFLPHRVLLAFIRSYARTSLWLLRVVCGIKVEWRGIEKIPSGACLIACKHQSAWETFALYAVLRDPAYILKRELMWMPLFGEPVYKPGIAYLYSKTNVACVPLALNSGLFWPRRSLRRVPGTILVEALEPIAPGLDRKIFAARLESVLEEATARLVAEAGSGIRDQGSGIKNQ